MKSIKHWTPRYVWCRIVEAIDQRANPKSPWLTKESVKLIDELLLPSDLALEFGGGRSTAWIARRVKHVTSVDDSPEWSKIVEKQIKDVKLTNATLLLRSQDVEESEGSLADGPRDESCRKFMELTNGWRKIWTDSGFTATLLVFKP